jgi:hypothetical protein
MAEGVGESSTRNASMAAIEETQICGEQAAALKACSRSNKEEKSASFSDGSGPEITMPRVREA